MQSIKMKNGMTLHVIPTDQFKTEALSITFFQPMEEEKNGKRALLPYVLRSGCQDYGSLKGINQELQRQYSAALSVYVRKKGHYQGVGYFLTYLDDRLAFGGECISDACLELLKNVLLHPITKDGAFDADIVAQEKKNLKDLLESRMNDKILYGLDKCNQHMCKGSPYALSEYGRMEDFGEEGITGASLYEAYQELLQNARCELVYIGRKDGAEMAAKLEQVLGEIHPGALALDAQPLDVSGSQGGEVTEELSINQCKLTMGFTTGVTVEEDVFPTMMANVIFGGGPTSKLFMNVREKLSLCYYATSRYDNITGQILVYSGIEKKNLDVAKAEILHQLEELKQGKVTDEEFDAAKMSVINSLRTAKDSTAAMESVVVSNLFRKEPMTVDQMIEEIRRVTKEDAIQAAQKIQPHTTYILV